MASSHLRKTFKRNDKDQNKPIKGLQRMQKQMQGRGNLEITVTNILKEGGEDIAPIKHKMLRKKNNQRVRGALVGGWQNKPINRFRT